MPLPKEEAWFAPKKYGWGWGGPRRWQGWVALGVYAVAVVAGVPLVKVSPEPAIYLAYCFALTAILVAICYWKGEPPRWRWGDKDL